METIKSFFNFPFFSLGDYSFRLYNLIFFAITIVLFRIIFKFFKAFVNKTVKKRDWIDEEKIKNINNLGRITLILGAIFFSLKSLNLGILFQKFLQYEIISGENKITVSDSLYGLFALLICIILIKFFVMLIRASVRKNGSIDRGREFMIVKLFNYLGYFIAFMIALYVAGVNLKGLFIGSAALLVGVGIGLQHLFGDFVAGIVLLFEDSFDVGDIIFMEEEIVQVKRISLRTSTVMQTDGNLLTIPNRLLTDNKIVNWSQGSPFSRMEIYVSVAYGSNMELVKSLLYQSALAHPKVDKKKPIKVFLEKFNDNGIDFTLLFWIKNTWEFREQLSDIRFFIDQKFRENNIEIPFPQRDLHIRSGLHQK